MHVQTNTQTDFQQVTLRNLCQLLHLCYCLTISFRMGNAATNFLLIEFGFCIIRCGFLTWGMGFAQYVHIFWKEIMSWWFYIIWRFYYMMTLYHMLGLIIIFFLIREFFCNMICGCFHLKILLFTILGLHTLFLEKGNFALFAMVIS